MIFFGAFFGVMGVKKDQETFAVCDGLNAAVASAFSLACKLRRIPRVAIVTDLPDMFDAGRLRKTVSNFLLRRFDGYVYLTEYMNEYMGGNKPYIVLEGHVDAAIAPSDPQTAYEEQDGTKVVLYAGNIHSKYGIKALAEGFMLADIPDAQLRVYGAGDYQEPLVKLCEKDPRIRYMGRAANEVIVKEEQKASLLVNPRPTDNEYTKYSFPSKNMEYMASGTPLLTTKLPGMPEEYDSYVYLIEDESAKGIAKTLQKVLALSRKERVLKGQRARDFVLTQKTNVIQSGRIMDFCRRIV